MQDRFQVFKIPFKLLPFLVLFMCVFNSCKTSQTKQTLTGDLYFSFFRFASYYNQPDSLVDQVKMYFDTLDIQTASEEDKHFVELYRIISDNKLIYKPYVDIFIEPDSIVKLYLNQEDYDKIKIHKRQDLQNNNKKIVISASVTDYSKGIYFCDSLMNIKKVNGKTLQLQKKFRIEDYE